MDKGWLKDHQPRIYTLEQMIGASRDRLLSAGSSSPKFEAGNAIATIQSQLARFFAHVTVRRDDAEDDKIVTIPTLNNRNLSPYQRAEQRR
ncbi:hypothetical protein GCM10009853_037440 [Glycomyces scopariae]